MSHRRSRTAEVRADTEVTNLLRNVPQTLARLGWQVTALSG